MKSGSVGLWWKMVDGLKFWRKDRRKDRERKRERRERKRRRVASMSLAVELEGEKRREERGSKQTEKGRRLCGLGPWMWGRKEEEAKKEKSLWIENHMESHQGSPRHYAYDMGHHTSKKVQEKKVKKICDMNVDPSQVVGNGSIAGPSISTSAKVHLPNGGFSERPYSCLSNDVLSPPGGIPSLHLPVVASQETSLVARCRRIYAHAHDYHINSISNNSDGETFISADDLRINLWNLEISNQSFNIVDVKPANMEDLTEVITSAEFHPTHCNMLAYSSSKGSIRLVDLRQSALCDTHTKLFEEPETPGSRSFFTEIIASISDIKFGKDGRHILSRDYMTLKLWDINMDAGPVATFQVHEYLRPRLCDLYENDSIFDKFECCLSGDGLRVATGSYSNLFRMFGCAAGSNESTTLEASKNPIRRHVQTPSRPSRSLSSRGADTNGNVCDFTTKLLHLAWHPTENSLACAAANSLYMYYA
ncbi:serine/threonine protein phosphatase 2A 55 kDa regulatory subunit B beta isoform-like isoform X2 [Tasmannia lanceolata]|uniref:serine/threonine protein phosphatase 2A 55 kDa regulatory subunit B beta isoform-like isoform X2 n=1 Tax=Tasmannia lanceolata TaxID=3420 RepID=UPI004063117F